MATAIDEVGIDREAPLLDDRPDQREACVLAPASALMEVREGQKSPYEHEACQLALLRNRSRFGRWEARWKLNATLR